MGKYRTSKELYQNFAKPLTELAAEFEALSKRWNKAYQSGKIARPDLLLNDSMPEDAVALLRKFLRDTAGKLDDAIAGVYRYRDTERRLRVKRGGGADAKNRS